jgi:hypothetical protein
VVLRSHSPEAIKANKITQLAGLTLKQYAEGKGLPVSFLRKCGLSDLAFGGLPAVRIPYLGPVGEELAIRFRIALGRRPFPLEAR